MTSNSTTCQLAQVWDQHFIGIMCSPKFEGKTHKDGPTRTARSRSLCVFFFSREEWKNMSMCFIFAMDFQCVPFFSEILIAKFRFRHSERRWMLVFWKKMPISCSAGDKSHGGRTMWRGEGATTWWDQQVGFHPSMGLGYLGWVRVHGLDSYQIVPGILSLWRLGCKNCRWIAESSGSERVIAWSFCFGWFCAFCRQ